MAVLTAWDNFYVIVGSSAGALTGLTFIAVTLVAGRPQRGTSWGIGAFTTPTVVHFSVVLFISALLSAPWSTLTPAAYVLGICGVAGVASGVVVVRRFRRQGTYQPVGEDWLWFAFTPLVIYSALFVAALLLPSHPVQALFVVAAVMAALLFLGIRNAWDVVTYIAIDLAGEGDSPATSSATAQVSESDVTVEHDERIVVEHGEQ